jgi:hypothetical protein
MPNLDGGHVNFVDSNYWIGHLPGIPFQSQAPASMVVAGVRRSFAGFISVARTEALAQFEYESVRVRGAGVIAVLLLAYVGGHSCPLPHCTAPREDHSVWDCPAPDSHLQHCLGFQAPD